MSVALAGLALLALVYVGIAAGLFLMQRRILFRCDPERPRCEVPGVREIAVATVDGLELLAWFLPPAEGSFVVLYFHGNAGTIGHRAFRFDGFAALGWGALMLEYRGYGGNPGKPSEKGLALDASAGLAALLAMGFPADRIILWGESLGTGVAVRLASEHSVAAVLLESPYTSITDIARVRYWFVPVRQLLRDHFDSLAAIGRVRAPVLVMHGAHDSIVPAAMGRAIHAAANDPKALWIAPDAGHFDLVEAGAVAVARDFVGRSAG